MFISHHVKPGQLITIQLLNDICTFMIRNKDLVSSSELFSMCSVTEEEKVFCLKYSELL